MGGIGGNIKLRKQQGGIPIGGLTFIVVTIQPRSSPLSVLPDRERQQLEKT